MANQDSAKSGCFSGFLKVALCAGKGNTPPVHPSDHITESDETELLVHPKKEAMANAAAPGVVARLMGLDSLPNTKWVSKATNPDSVPRSRSVNFVDYLLEFDLSQTKHRRVKTSASFREVPSVFQRQNHDLVVLYWDNASKNEEVRSDLRKTEIGLGESKQKKRQGRKNKDLPRDRVAAVKEKNHGKNKKISKLKNEPRRAPAKHSPKVSANYSGAKARDFGSASPRSKNYSYRNGGAASSSNSSSNSPLPNRKKEAIVESKLKRKIRNPESPKKIETEYCSEKLSPVSVLDVDYFPFLNETNFSDDLSPLAPKSRWEYSEQLCLGDATEDRSKDDEGYAYHDVNKETQRYSELMAKIWRLTEKEFRESDCRIKSASESEGFEEICLVFEHKIFEFLLHEVVSELVQP